MAPASPQDESTTRPAHPLALRLIDRLRPRPAARILDFATGNGRNSTALRKAGFEVFGIEDSDVRGLRPRQTSAEPYTAILSTHGFLHGTHDEIAQTVAIIATHLEDGGLLCATFGSTSDARFGEGERLAPTTFAPLEGDERGIAHTYFTEDALRVLLEPLFTIESLEEHGIDNIAGSWAHKERPLSSAVHWFVVAQKAHQ
jgi:hypothetical protein